MKFYRITFVFIAVFFSFSTLASTLPKGHQWVSLSAVNQVVWVGNTEGQVALSADGGKTFELSELHHTFSVRQLLVLDELHGYALTSGQGAGSALFITRNGGYSWRPLYEGSGREHLRCMGMNPERESWILGDSKDGHWHVVGSNNGRHWRSSRSGFTKRPLDNEQASDSSDSCVRFENNTWLMGTQKADTARIMFKQAGDLRFDVADTPLAGVSAVWPLARQRFLIAGGNQQQGELYFYAQGAFSKLNTPVFEGAIEVLYQQADRLYMGNADSFYRATLAQVLANKADWQEVQPGVGARSFTCTTEQCWLLGGDNKLYSISP